MKQGKVSEVVLKRSVLKNILSKNEEIVVGPGIAADSGIVRLSGNIAVSVSGAVDYADNDVEYYTFYKAFNNLLAKGAEPAVMTLNIIMPYNEKEKNLKAVTKAYDFLCCKHHMGICGGHTQYSKEVNHIISNVTMIGKIPEDAFKFMKCREIAQKVEDIRELQIVMTKAMGIEGTAILSKDREEVLRQRFHGHFCDECVKFKEYISVEKEAKIAAENGAVFMHDVSGGGVFGAIWEIAEAFDTGAEVDLRKIPVWQETIEVTELFDINPYKMASQGSLLIVTKDGKAMAEKLERQEIPAKVIGNLSFGKDRVLMNHEEKRYLEPPRGDDIYLVKEEHNQEKCL